MDLYYEVTGTGKPIVLLHSGGADLRDWTFVAPLLAENYKVIAVDGRGAGRSPSPVKPANYIQDLLDLLDHLQIPQATLVGHSMGGQIATDFALEYPERVSELILIAPELSGFERSLEFKNWMEKVNSALPDMDKVAELSLSAPLYQITMASPQRELIEEMLRHHLKKIGEWTTFESVWPKPAIKRLEHLSVKTLFIIGEVELPDNKRVAEHFQRVPDIRFVLLSDADHMVTLTHPNELTHHITRFLEE
ncbi:alpha/beta hydrolase [Shimazuella sp. AN120528]|uniref:alpha/beta fold hydrolase n=1 Tax=Shimazuella soli TaxID=1892854 RepID=UPI001F0E6820|nr:alpha/beta hydrolase [Shimazuella soli]MCH5584931.1 alpha/beta hydrolase [Shimazuella soli]